MTLVSITIDGRNVKDVLIGVDGKEEVEKFILENMDEMIEGINPDMFDDDDDDDDDEPSHDVQIELHPLARMQDDEVYWRNRIDITASMNDGEYIVTDKKHLVSARFNEGSFDDTFSMSYIGRAKKDRENMKSRMNISGYIIRRYVDTFFPDLK